MKIFLQTHTTNTPPNTHARQRTCRFRWNDLLINLAPTTGNQRPMNRAEKILLPILIGGSILLTVLAFIFAPEHHHH